jgi:PAS domain S-box-containing protein
MKDERKTKNQLIAELTELRQKLMAAESRTTELETAEAERKQAEARLMKLNECFMSFGDNTIENINYLTALCGEMLNATCALYNRLDGEMLCSVGQWNTPLDYNPEDKPEGHICYDVIQQGKDDIFIIRNLLETPYAQTDPNVIPYKLQTYVGWPVKFGDGYVGSLCVVYQDDFVPSEADKEFLEIIASAIGVEEARKQAEKALRESEEMYKALIDASPEAVTVTDLAGRITYISQQAIELHGAECATELLGKAARDLIAPEDHEKAAANLGRTLTEGIVRNQEYTLLRKDGSRFSGELNAAVIKDAQGKPQAFIATVRDITERKRAEETLKESEEKFRTLAEQSPNMIFINKMGRVVYANKRCEEIMGYGREEFYAPDFDFITLVAPSDWDMIWSNFARHKTHLEIEPYEYTLVTKTGQTVEVVITTRLVDYEGEKAILGIVTDISQQKQTEEAQRRYAERLNILRRIDQAILEAQSPEEIAQAALHHIRLLISCQRANVAVFDPAAREASILAKTPSGDTQPSPGARIPLEPFGNILAELQRGETYVINDIMDYPEPPPIVQVQQAVGVRAYACTPLIVQGELIGALSLSANTPGCFGREQIEIAHELANHLAIVIQQARLHRQVQHHAQELEQRVTERTRDLERRTAHLQVAAEVARDATTAHDLNDLLNNAVDLIRERFGFYHAGIFLLDGSGEYAVLRAATGEAGRQMLEDEHKLKVGETGIVGYATGSGQPRISLDVGIDAVHFVNPFLPETRSEMALPLKVGGRIIGALDVQSIHEAAFSKDDVDTLQIMADQLAVAIERTRLFERAQATLTERLRTVISNAPIILFALDRAGKFTLSEVKGLEALGFQPGEHVGQSILDVYSDVPNILENVPHALEGGIPPRVMAVRDALFEIWASPTYDESGEITGVIGVATNITKRMRVEEALRESEEKYRLVSENIPVTVYSALPDEHSTNLFISGRMEELTGYPPEQFMQDPQLWAAIVHPEDREHLWKRLEEHRKNKYPLDVEYRIVTQDGAIKWIRDRATPMLDENGEILRINGFMEDITERKHLEEQVRLQERLAAVGQLAGGIAHDFNNFLTTIMLYAQILLRKPGLSPDLAPVAETILEESRRAAQLVQRMLDFSRRSIIETRPIDLASFITETADILRRTLPENIKLTLGPDIDKCVVNADPTRVQQVVMNLALNARDAMPDGGELHIWLDYVTVEPETEPPVAEMACGEWVRLAISDTGTGMTEKVQSHLFEPFFTTKGPKGTGLGLAQVYGIVKQHGGAIKVETQTEHGTTFSVYFPAHEAIELQKDQKATAAPPQGHGEVILLAEDEEKVREAGQEILESLGYQVLTVENGREALKAYQAADQIDLVLTDMVMPEMGGKELVQELYKIAPGVKVLAITGYTLVGDVQSLRKAGILDVIRKPFEVTVLANTIRQALDSD